MHFYFIIFARNCLSNASLFLAILLELIKRKKKQTFDKRDRENANKR